MRNYSLKIVPAMLMATAALGGLFCVVPIVAAQSAPATLGPPAITRVDGTLVSLNVGTNRGLKPGTNVPVVRGGNIVALVRVQSVTVNSSTGLVVWREENINSIATGDLLGLEAGGVGNSAGIPSAPQLYESGASNIGVAAADRTYI